MRRLLLILFLAAAPVAAEPPRLVVLIVIDQFPTSYLDRMPENGALNSVRRTAAAYSRAHHSHVPTETAPGHATIATGRPPSVN
jgi:predicted AlkP superfamily pyrophosphatase or phosphodiesterase